MYLPSILQRHRIPKFKESGGNSAVKKVGKGYRGAYVTCEKWWERTIRFLKPAHGTSVNILETANGWHKVSGIKWVTTTGYVSAEWISTDNSGGNTGGDLGGNTGGNSGGTAINKTGVVTAGDGLNIRRVSGTSYSKMGTLTMELRSWFWKSRMDGIKSKLPSMGG